MAKTKFFNKDTGRWEEVGGDFSGDIDLLKKGLQELEKTVDDIPEVFHNAPMNAVTEDMIPSDFDYGVTICNQGQVGGFPTINDYGVSITIRGVHASYAQIFITRFGDMWSRGSGVINEWNGEWYNSKREIEEKADKTYVDNKIDNIDIPEVDLSQIEKDISSLKTSKADKKDIGDLPKLETENKSNLVEAINEIAKDDSSGALHNFNALKPPTENDDESKGYSKGSMWFMSEEQNVVVYMCLSSLEGNAQWKIITSTDGAKVYYYKEGRDFLDFEYKLSSYSEESFYEERDDYIYIYFKIIRKDFFMNRESITITSSSDKFIDLKNINTLFIDWENHQGIDKHNNSTMSILDGNDKEVGRISLSGNFDRKISTIDVSNLKGSYRLKLYFNTNSQIVDSNTSREIKIYNIWGV